MTETALYVSPQPTRSARARWAFLEAGVPFAPRTIDIFAGEHKKPEFLAVNPLGLVPVALVDGQPMIESAALALMVALDDPKERLVPARGTPAWREFLQWMIFAPAELDRPLATLNAHTRLRPLAERNPGVAEEARSLLARRAALVARTLEARPHLLGERFSMADVCVGHAVAWAAMLDLLGELPSLRAYLARLQARPAFIEVYGPEIAVFPDPYAAA